MSTTGGDFAVIITQNGCTDTSECCTLDPASVNEQDFMKDIICTPNPKMSYVSISCHASHQTTVTVCEITSALLLERKNVNGKTLDLDLSSLSQGI